jgi:hypothetical protein
MPDHPGCTRAKYVAMLGVMTPEAVVMAPDALYTRRE